MTRRVLERASDLDARAHDLPRRPLHTLVHRESVRHRRHGRSIWQLEPWTRWALVTPQLIHQILRSPLGLKRGATCCLRPHVHVRSDAPKLPPQLPLTVRGAGAILIIPQRFSLFFPLYILYPLPAHERGVQLSHDRHNAAHAEEVWPLPAQDAQ